MWSNQASEQIEAIHAMLASGHRSVYMERHTLIYWGLAAAGLILLVAEIFTPERFPVTWIRAIASAAFIGSVLALVGYFDFRQLRRSRDQRSESISFVQLQITKVWWLLVGLIVLINLAMHFFGGGYMFYSLVLILMGLALYFHGLFSKQMLSHVGILMIFLGLASISLRLPFEAIKWLTILCFGIGWPILGLSLNLPIVNRSFAHRLIFSLVWLGVVILPALGIYKLGTMKEQPNVQVVSLAQYMQETPVEPAVEEVVALAAGSTIPLKIELSGDVIDGLNSITLPMVLSQQMEIVLKEGKPDGRFRVANGPWKAYVYNYRIRDFSMTSSLDRQQGPQVNLKLYVSTNN